jgi:hypothetical protein
MTHVFLGTSYFIMDVNENAALHDSLSLETSSCDLKDLEALISRGSYPQDRAAANTRVVFPIPGVPPMSTLYLGVFF